MTAIIITLIVLFFITWIVIASNSNSSDFPPIPLTGSRPFEDTWKYQELKNNMMRVDRIESNLMMLREDFKNKFIDCSEKNISKIETFILVAELKKRGALESKNVIR